MKVQAKNSRTTILRHPLQLLYPQENKCKDQHKRESKFVKRSTEYQVTESPIVRVQRRTAVEARNQVNVCMIELEDSVDRLLLWSKGGGGGKGGV